MEISDIDKFLFESIAHSYANPDVEIKDEPDGSHTIEYSSGNLRLHDNYFGGEPFGGRQVIFEDNKPVWMMVYYGSVVDHHINFKEVYKFLRKALNNTSEESPYRGPAKFEDGEWLYTNKLEIDASERFVGVETIIFQGDIVYSAEYQGGFVDVKQE